MAVHIVSNLSHHAMCFWRQLQYRPTGPFGVAMSPRSASHRPRHDWREGGWEVGGWEVGGWAGGRGVGWVEGAGGKPEAGYTAQLDRPTGPPGVAMSPRSASHRPRHDWRALRDVSPTQG